MALTATITILTHGNVIDKIGLGSLKLAPSMMEPAFYSAFYSSRISRIGARLTFLVKGYVTAIRQTIMIITRISSM